jgi:hypothetical protein
MMEPLYSDHTLEELRAMTGEERLRIAMQLTNEYRRRIAERFRAEHPGCAEWEVKLELLRVAFDPEPVPEPIVEWLKEHGHRHDPPGLINVPAEPNPPNPP